MDMALAIDSTASLQFENEWDGQQRGAVHLGVGGFRLPRTSFWPIGAQIMEFEECEDRKKTEEIVRNIACPHFQHFLTTRMLQSSG